MAPAVESSYSESRRNFLRGKLVRPATASVPGTPRLAQTGDACLASRNIVCRACGDTCEAGAIRFRPRVGGAALPEVSPEQCTGCGDCLTGCPTQAIALVYATKEHTV